MYVMVLQPYGDNFMRSKLAIFALVVSSLFGSTLLAAAQNQAAPGASNDGSVSPGATGKKMPHEKGMTTGSSTRSGVNKGGTANPATEDNAATGSDNMAAPRDNVTAPKSGSKY
jgi:hypothetical protein